MEDTTPYQSNLNRWTLAKVLKGGFDKKDSQIGDPLFRSYWLNKRASSMQNYYSPLLEVLWCRLAVYSGTVLIPANAQPNVLIELEPYSEMVLFVHLWLIALSLRKPFHLLESS